MAGFGRFQSLINIFHPVKKRKLIPIVKVKVYKKSATNDAHLVF
jgi:hypothetical protein